MPISPGRMSGFQVFSFPGWLGGVKSCPDPTPSSSLQRFRDASGDRARTPTRAPECHALGHFGVSRPQSRGPRACLGRAQGSALGSDRRGVLLKVLYKELPTSTGNLPFTARTVIHPGVTGYGEVRPEHVIRIIRPNGRFVLFRILG